MSHSTIKRVAIKDLRPDVEDILIVAIMIGKSRPRKFTDTKQNDSERAVWNFTLRDSQRDYINVTQWGLANEVFTLNDKFYTGDVVEVKFPRVIVRVFEDSGEQFRPMVTSPFTLILTERSKVNPHPGDTSNFRFLLRLPTKPMSGFVPLRDIHNQGEAIVGRSVDILVAVRSIGEIKNITSKRGEIVQLREIVLFDQTSPGFKLTVFDVDVMTRAALWKSRTTILFITDVKINWSSFMRTYTATLSARTIVTEDPKGPEANILANYAKDAPIETSDFLDQMITSLPDAESIQNVMSVQQVHDKLNVFTKENRGDQQFTALLYVCVTRLDLDGVTPPISYKCSSCRKFIKYDSRSCANPNCATVTGDAVFKPHAFLDIRVDLTDHTGTLINCKLSGQSAETLLEYSVSEFLMLPDSVKCDIKWKYLMERCAVRIMVMYLGGRKPIVSIVSCGKVSANEVTNKMPVF